jgi:hypothetical protein
MLAEVARAGARRVVREQALAEEQHDDHRADDERHADQGEREVSEASVARLGGELRGDDVHRRARERQQRAGVRPERQRQEELAGRAAQAHRRDHDQRHEGRHRPVDADQRRQPGHQQREQDDQPRAALPHPDHQVLAGPGGDAGRVEALAHHEQRGDEQDRRVAKPGQRGVQRQDVGGPQGQRRPEGHDGHRQAVEDEDDDHRREHDEGDGLVAHGGPERCRDRLTCRWASPVRAGCR